MLRCGLVLQLIRLFESHILYAVYPGIRGWSGTDLKYESGCDLNLSPVSPPVSHLYKVADVTGEGIEHIGTHHTEG